MTEQSTESWLYSGLRELAAGAFPKTCPTCKRVYATSEEYVHATERVNGRTGLKSGEDDDGAMIVNLFRNCVCGSTLLAEFRDRRDTSPQGLQRRERFGLLLEHLVAQGMERELARAELLKVTRGQSSELLADFRPPPLADQG